MRGALYRGNLGESQTASGEEYIPSSSKDLVFTGNHAQRAPGTSCRISKSQRKLTIVVDEGLEATLVNGGRQRCSTVNYSSVYEVQPPPRHRPVQPTPSYSASFGRITVRLFPSCYCIRQCSAAEQDYDSEGGTSILCTVSYPHCQWILRGLSKASVGHIAGLIGLSEFSPLLSNKPLSSLPAEFSEPLLLIGSPRCVQCLPID